MALHATFRGDLAVAESLRDRTPFPAAVWRRLMIAVVLAAAFVFGMPDRPASADEATVGPVAVASPAAAPDGPRNVTISVRSPIRVLDGDRVTLQSMLRFSGRAWEDARIEILANGIVVSETTAMRGGLWYAPRARLAPGAYEFSARAVAPDGTKEISDILRITVSPPILIDPEALAGKSATWVG
jgi:hypothetical protein